MNTPSMSSKNLSDIQRRAIYEYLLQRSVNMKLPSGSLTTATETFKVSYSTVQRIWKRGKESSALGIPADVSGRKKNNCGRKPVPDSEIKSKIRSLNLSNRQNYRRMAYASGINKDTLVKAKKRGVIVRHSSAVRPSLSNSNKLERINFALSHINMTTGGQYVFRSMDNNVDVDEMLFNLFQAKDVYYLFPDETGPYQTAQSKKFIAKVLFLCAVARPRYDYYRKRYFDGKIGIWPFVEEFVAQRNSRNRPAGTIELKPMNVTKEIYTEYLVNKDFPAIRQKFPFRRNKTVIIQQDYARPHISPNDPSILEANFNQTHPLKILSQPPNSPDFNVLDLGFFNAIQSLQYKTRSSTVPQLIECVENVFNTYEYENLLDVFITLQSVLKESLSVLGGNNFKISHLKKSKMDFQTKMNYNHRCDSQTNHRAYNYYNENA